MMLPFCTMYIYMSVFVSKCTSMQCIKVYVHWIIYKNANLKCSCDTLIKYIYIYIDVSITIVICKV